MFNNTNKLRQEFDLKLGKLQTEIYHLISQIKKLENEVHELKYPFKYKIGELICPYVILDRQYHVKESHKKMYTVSDTRTLKKDFLEEDELCEKSSIAKSFKAMHDEYNKEQTKKPAKKSKIK